jgi:hypothetical protein
MKYRGIIIEESLNDNRILNNFNILKLYITEAAKRSDQWHLFEVEVEENEIENFSKLIIEGWYTPFWHGSDVVAVFTNKIIKFNYLDKNTWNEVIEYGKKLNIPEKQLDFPIFGL